MPEEKKSTIVKSERDEGVQEQAVSKPPSHEFSRGGGRGAPFIPPPIFSVHRGVIKRVQDFGAFVEINDLGGKWGLVHWGQLINQVLLCFRTMKRIASILKSLIADRFRKGSSC
jgi:hypothetical protein